MKQILSGSSFPWRKNLGSFVQARSENGGHQMKRNSNVPYGWKTSWTGIGCSRRMGPWDDGTQNRNYPTFDRSMIDSATLQFVAPRKLACIIPPWRTCCSRTNVKSFDTAPGVVWNSCVVFRKKLMYYSTFSTSCHPHKRFCWWRLQ